VAPDERRGREVAREPLARGRREPRVARELALLAQEGLAQLRRGDVGLEHGVLDEAPAAAPQVREEDDGLGRRAHGRDGDGPRRGVEAPRHVAEGVRGPEQRYDGQPHRLDKKGNNGEVPWSCTRKDPMGLRMLLTRCLRAAGGGRGPLKTRRRRPRPR
jgi:hypothetical protein